MCDRRCLQQTPSSLTNEYVVLLFENERTIIAHGKQRKREECRRMTGAADMHLENWYTKNRKHVQWLWSSQTRNYYRIE